MKTTGIILAGGKGERLKTLTRDKIMLRIGAGAVISWSVSVFAQSGLFDELILTYRNESQRDAIEAELQRAVKDLPPIIWVQGGEQRQDSVHKALCAVTTGTQWVYIHDGARPFITIQDLQSLKTEVQKNGSAALASPVTDTIKRANRCGSTESLQLEDLDRSRLYAMQTPQVFEFEKINNAYQKLVASQQSVTDCVEALNQLNNSPTTLVFPEQNNFKITRPEDVALANFLIHSGSIKKVFELAYS